jgi:hypothetical protein
MMVGVSYRGDLTPPVKDSITAARNVAFLLRNASDELRKYAILAAEGIDSPVSLALARNNIALAMQDMKHVPDGDVLQAFERHMVEGVRS